MKVRSISIVIVFSLLIAMFVPAYAVNEEDIYASGSLVIGKIEAKDNSLVLMGSAEADVTAVLLKPGHSYSEVINSEYNDFLDVCEGFDNFDTKDGQFIVKFEHDGQWSGYSIFLSDGNNTLEVPAEEYLRTEYIYVSPSGNDNNPGTQSAPLKTLDAARKAVNNCNKNAASVNVVLEEGVYDWESVVFEEEDSGSDEFIVKYISDGAEFRGTKTIPYSAFTKVSDAATVSKLSSNAKNSILCVNLKDVGITADDVDFLSSHSAGESAFVMGVYVDGKRQMLARYPNTGYMKIDDVISEGGTLRWDTDEGVFAQFCQYDENIKRWENAKAAYGVGYFGVEYHSEWAEIANIDGSLQTISFADRTSYGVKKNFKWYITNLIEEIDIPGEWYIDTEEMKLYYFPTENFNADSEFEIAVKTNPLITVNDAKNIDFSGFKIFGVNSDGVKISNGTNICLNDFDISHTKGCGIVMGGNGLTINNCKIHNTYDTGIYVTNGGNRMTLTDSGNVISNNHIYKCGSDAGSNSHGGIYIAKNNVGTEVKNNLIHSIKNYSYYFGGNNNLFSYNEVWAGNRETSDSTPIYCGRDWSEYGNKISYNYVHDCYNKDTDTVYTNVGLCTGDDMQAGTTVENNIVTLSTEGKAIALTAGSRDNVVKNNIFVDASTGISMGDNNKYFGSYLTSDSSSIQTLLSTLEKSAGLEEGYATTEAWLDKYPQVSTIYKDLVEHDGMLRPVNVVVTGNISVNAPNNIDWLYYNLKYASIATVKNNKEVSTKGIFVDADNHDFRITNAAMTEYSFDTNVINESNFKMSEIGVQTQIDKPSLNFELTYPFNESQVDASCVCLAWTEADFADEYTVQVASDEDFKNIIYNADTINACAYPENLVPGSTYYWKVVARNLSKQIGATCESDIHCFTVSNGKVDGSSSCYKATDTGTILNVDIKNNTASKIDNKDLYVAFYDSHGRFMGTKMEKVTIDAGGEYEHLYEYTDAPEYSLVKMFLFNENLTPLMNVVFPYQRVNVAGAEYFLSDFECIGEGWADEGDVSYASIKNDSVSFSGDFDDAGEYDLYYYLEAPENGELSGTMEVTVETLTGIGGGSQIYPEVTIDLNNATIGYAYLGRYKLMTPDNKGWTYITAKLTSDTGCMPAVRVKAVRVY